MQWDRNNILTVLALAAMATLSFALFVLALAAQATG